MQVNEECSSTVGYPLVSCLTTEDLGLGEKPSCIILQGLRTMATEEQERTLRMTWQRVKEDYGRGSIKGLIAKEGLGTLG